MEPFEVHTRHASRLRIYRESDFEITQDLKDHIVFANGGHLVKQILDCRINRDTQTWEILVEWIGLDSAENSWKPATIMQEDVLVMLSKWVQGNPKGEAMWRAIEVKAQRKRGK